MKIENLKVGDVLIAINECDMNRDGTDKRLTLGKEYVITYKGVGHIRVIDNIGNDHSFTDILKFFKLKPKQFTKSDLKTGMRVEYRNKTIAFVNLEDYTLVDVDGFNILSDFNDDLIKFFIINNFVLQYYK